MELHRSPLPYSKKSKREMSPFMAKELLYDYVTERLDPERREAIDRVLKSEKEVENELIKLLNGVHYVELLSEARVSPGLLEEIAAPETYLSVLLKKTNFEKWPLMVKWGVEAFVVFAGFIVVLSLIPWDKALRTGFALKSQEWILAEIQRSSEDAPVNLLEKEKSEPAQFEDEGVETAGVTPPQTSPQVANPAPSVETPPAAAATPNAPVAVAKIETKPSKPEVSKKAGEGALYRGVVRVKNLEMLGPKTREKILELGGRKAGEVELGWKKTPSSMYFHFTMPQARSEELQAFIKNLGQGQLVKEKHPRVMPDGIMRLIITLEEAGP